MSARVVVFLGTASQVPTRQRSHNALFLQWDDLGILFDPGEGTQRQMTLAGLSATQITHVVLTHFHGDHCLGLPGVLQRLSLDRVPGPVPLIYPASGQRFVNNMRRASIFFDARNVVDRPLTVPPGEVVEVFRHGPMKLVARALEHGVECLGYRLEEEGGRRMLPEKLAEAGLAGPEIGRLQREGTLEKEGRVIRVTEVSEERIGQVFTLVLDTRPCLAAVELARGADLLVCEATYLDSERQEAHEHHHMTAGQAAALAAEAGARRLALTHFSQRYFDLRDHLAEAQGHHADVHVAEDLDRISVPPRRS
jgi:ribonuclease Z